MFAQTLVSFAVLALFKSALAISDDLKSQIQTKFLTVGAECLKDHPISIDDVASFKSKVFPEGENAGCFTACIFNKLGLIDDEGKLSHLTALENAKKVFEDEEEIKNIEAFLTTCAAVNDEEVSDGEKGCDRAKLAYNCFIKNIKQLGFDIDF
ncbi:general odorant-binding protein 69a-like isoform X2 [Helicoverpa zea]|uniref:general odorant-binding protein 69a-like isoform X2 n=1 Tax=Helicoverpa zea TaxID=7113 RepID=UPI001F57CC11|nr:general odorant-binding protein 69a-like isoform X2 [Helicoverpa zea]